MNTSLLQLQNITKKFHHGHTTTTIFQDLSFTFQAGCSYALMGPSGIGKSTLLHIIAGIETPSSGSLGVNNYIIPFHDFEKRIAALHDNIGIIFQHPSLIGELSVLENVMLTAIAHNSFDEATTTKALKLLSEVGLESKAHSAPNTLSGGQQQRVAILRALFHAPSFLLADEPTGNLDENTAQQIMNMLTSYQKKYAMGLIISTHDIKIAQQCDVILQVKDHGLVAV